MTARSLGLSLLLVTLLVPHVFGSSDAAAPEQVAQEAHHPIERCVASEAVVRSEYWQILGHELKITDTLLSAFTLLLFIATLALWYATSRLSASAIRQESALTKSIEANTVAAAAAQRSAAIAEATLNASQRPWIRFDFSAEREILIEDTAAGFRVNFEITNLGNAPAIHVIPSATLFRLDHHPDIRSLIERFNWPTYSEENKERGLGEAIFPEETVGSSRMAIVFKDDFEAAPGICIFLLVGVSYRFASLLGEPRYSMQLHDVSNWPKVDGKLSWVCGHHTVELSRATSYAT